MTKQNMEEQVPAPDRYDLYHEKKKGILSKILNFLFFLALLALIVYGVMLLFGGCEQTENNNEQTQQEEQISENNNNSTEVETIEITNDPLERVNFKKVGTVEPYKSATITSQTSGSIADFEVSEGDNVEKGQQIASIQDSVATTVAKINYETALISLDNAEKVLESTKNSVNKDIQMAAIGVENAQIGLKNSIDSYNNAVLTWDEQIKSAMLGVQSAQIGYSGSQESYYNSVTSVDINLDSTVDNSLSSIVSAITLIENTAQLSEAEFEDDSGLYDDYDNLLNDYEDVRDSRDVNEAIDLIENTLNTLEDSQDVLIDIKDFTEDSTTKTSATTLLTTIDQTRSGLNMNKQSLNNALLNYDAQPEGTFTGMEASGTQVLSAQKAVDIVRANQKTQLDALANAVELSKKQLDSAIVQLENVKAKANLQTLSAKTQLAQIEGQTKTAEANLKGTKVLSPISGTLLQKFVEEGNYVNPSQSIVKIGDMSKVYITVSLTAEELQYVKLGQNVKITTPAGLESTGKVTKVLPTLDPVTKKVGVKILIPNKDNKYISGMFTDVIFSDAQQNSVGALVPFKSIIFETDKTYVYVVENNKAVKKEVKLGQIVGSNIEIIDGLSLKDKVITKGAKLVKEGEYVTDVSNNND